MLKRTRKWTALYWPSILYTLFLTGIYLLLMGILFDVLWPLALENGEPVYVAVALNFREACIQAYQALGVIALVLYLLYTFNGLLSMSHEAHRRFSRDCRITVMECYFLLALNVVISLFTLPNMNILYTINISMAVMTLVLLVFYFIRLALFFKLKKRIKNGYWGVRVNIVAFVFSALLAGVLTILPDVLNGTVHLFNLIPCLNQLETQSAAGKYVLRLWIDGSLLMIPVVVGVFLLLLMRNASPLAACAPDGRAPRAMVYVKGLS